MKKLISSIKLFYLPENELTTLIRKSVIKNIEKFDLENSNKDNYKFLNTKFWKKDVGYKSTSRFLKKIVSKDLSLLDVGCSVGPLIRFLEHQNLKYKITYTGIDILNSDIQIARDFFPDEKFEAIDITQDKSNSKMYDIVYSKGTICSTSEPYNSLSYILKSSKEYVILIHTPLIDKQTSEKKFISTLYGNKTTSYLFNIPEKEYFLEKIKENNFEIIDIRQRNTFYKAINFGYFQIYDILLKKIN